MLGIGYWIPDTGYSNGLLMTSRKLEFQYEAMDNSPPQFTAPNPPTSHPARQPLHHFQAQTQSPQNDFNSVITGTRIPTAPQGPLRSGSYEPGRLEQIFAAPSNIIFSGNFDQVSLLHPFNPVIRNTHNVRLGTRPSSLRSSICGIY